LNSGIKFGKIKLHLVTQLLLKMVKDGSVTNEMWENRRSTERKPCARELCSKAQTCTRLPTHSVYLIIHSVQ